jgi:prepilin-type N-terminal cleavage/methylation domain-containing protein
MMMIEKRNVMNSESPDSETSSAGHQGSRGFTLSETIIVVFLIGIVAAITVTSIRNSIERARMASCMLELRGIQAALWHDIDGGNKKIDPETFWNTHYRGTRPGPYVLLVDDGQANGRPGSGEGTGADGQAGPAFVVVGRYEHWAPGQYVFIEDDKPPQIVTGPEEDPGYGRQVDWEAGKQWGPGSAGGFAPAQGVSWAGSRSTGTDSMAASSGGAGGSNRIAGPPGSSIGSSTSTGTGRNTSSRIVD